MLLTRAQIQQKLDALERSMPQLVTEHRYRGDRILSRLRKVASVASGGIT